MLSFWASWWCRVGSSWLKLLQHHSSKINRGRLLCLAQCAERLADLETSEYENTINIDYIRTYTNKQRCTCDDRKEDIHASTPQPKNSTYSLFKDIYWNARKSHATLKTNRQTSHQYFMPCDKIVALHAHNSKHMIWCIFS